MQKPASLPSPSAAALAHSQQLSAHIKETINQHQGKISFRHFMEMALYAPGLGYYVTGLDKLGETGDFTTAPEISPLFSRCLAHQCAQILSTLEQGRILELGAGSGIMAAHILQHLEQLDCLPQQYNILDISPELKQRQYATLQQQVPHLFGLVEWLDRLPCQPFQGIILANEVLDAMPVERFVLIDRQPFVLALDTEFNYITTATNHDTLPTIITENTPRFPTYYLSEYNPALQSWISNLADTLERGLMLLIDYGYEQADYYHPQRNTGTLLCHYRHHVHDNPLLWPGLQDITASVDFSAVAEAADLARLTVSGYTTQANFLFNNNLAEFFEQALINQPEQQQYSLARQVRQLTLPAEMGERFKVMALTKGFTSTTDHFTLCGFAQADQRHRL